MQAYINTSICELVPYFNDCRTLRPALLDSHEVESFLKHTPLQIRMHIH